MALELFTIQQPYPIAFSGCPITYVFACAPYTYNERRQDIRIKIELEKEVHIDAGIYTLVKSQVMYPDADGKISFDIASICDAYLQYTTPRLSIASHMPVQSQSARFRMIITLLKDSVAVGTPITTTPIIAIKGGLAYEASNYRKFFEENIFTQNSPLHYFTSSEIVRQSDTKFLYWIYNQDQEGSPLLRVSFHLASGAIQSYTKTDIFIVTKKYGIMCTPISLQKLIDDSGITSFASPIKSYTVSIVISTVLGFTYIVNQSSFAVDYRSYYNTTQLFYSNSLGGFDDINILGEIDSAAEYESSSAQQVPPPGGISNAVLQPQNISFNSETEKFTGSTSFITKNKVNRLRDLLLSNNVFELKNGQFIPVVINKKTVKFYGSKDNLFSLGIEWQHAFNNQFYTPVGSISGGGACPALLTFFAKQTAKGTMQIMWSAPMPYDLIEVTIDNGTPAELVTVNLSGNSGSQFVNFPNATMYPDTLLVRVRGRVICNMDVDPIDYGPFSSIDIDALGDSLPVASDDVYTIQAGFTTPQIFPISVMDNDYDPDGDAFEVLPASGTTSLGGAYWIDAAGIVTYTPPSAIFNGIDRFTYTIANTSNSALSDTAEVRINVGNVLLGSTIYVKLVERNHRDVINGNLTEAWGDFYLTFWADPAATIPKIPVPPITVNVRNKLENVGGYALIWTVTTNVLDTPVSVAGSTEKLIFSGEYYFLRIYKGSFLTYKGGRRTFTVEDGAGYIPI